jgi:hypothetical protein
VPPGRILFVRSGIPLVYGTAWYRPHTHVTALTPVETGRAIVNGTFTHPSPVAALVYRGDAGRAPIRQLVEQLDGHRLFGQALDELDAETFNRYADHLGVSAVVALDEDAPRLHALTENAAFAAGPAPAPFVIYVRRDGAGIPESVAPGRWRLPPTSGQSGWRSARVAYYPLWRAETGGATLPIRRGEWGDLEVRRDTATGPVDLVYGPGPAEQAGVALSAVALALALARGARRLGPSPDRLPSHRLDSDPG